MNLLLDTHTLLWWLSGEPLDPDAMTAIADPMALVAVSAASVWEAEIKRARGKLRFDGVLPDQIDEAGFEPLPISLAHAAAAGGLPPLHRDPFDRMLVAQAQLEDLTLVSRDRAFEAYEVDLLVC